MIRLVAGRSPSGRALAVKVEPICVVSPAVAAAIPNAVHDAPPRSIKGIQETVAHFYHVHPEYMRLPDAPGAREARFSHPRQVAMFFAREFTGHSLPTIGKKFGRDHSTVLHAIRTVQKRAIEDEELAGQLEALRERIAA